MNSWQYVVGSSCISENKLYACRGDISGSMTCNTRTATSNYVRFDVYEAQSHLWIGYSSWNGPNASFKDVRYYYNRCLNASEMALAKDGFTCKPLCETCTDPDTCST